MGVGSGGGGPVGVGLSTMTNFESGGVPTIGSTFPIGNGGGFREVLVDQPFTGKWMEVDMNLGKLMIEWVWF